MRHPSSSPCSLAADLHALRRFKLVVVGPIGAAPSQDHPTQADNPDAKAGSLVLGRSSLDRARSAPMVEARSYSRTHLSQAPEPHGLLLPWQDPANTGLVGQVHHRVIELSSMLLSNPSSPSPSRVDTQAPMDEVGKLGPGEEHDQSPSKRWTAAKRAVLETTIETDPQTDSTRISDECRFSWI